MIAAVYAAAFLLVGAIVPTYSSTSSSETSNGFTTHSSSSATKVAVNGMRVLFVLALPLVAVGLVWVSLKWRRRHGHFDAEVLAWIVVGLLGVVSFFPSCRSGSSSCPSSCCWRGRVRRPRPRHPDRQGQAARCSATDTQSERVHRQYAR